MLFSAHRGGGGPGLPPDFLKLLSGGAFYGRRKSPRP